MTSAGTEISFFRRRGRALLVGIGLAFAFAAIWQAYTISERTALSDLRKTSEERLNLYAGTLAGALEKFRYLPYVLARNKDIVGLFEKRTPVAQVNRYLEAVNAQAGSDVLFVMDHEGTTVASSNSRQSLSFIGKNYGFRPYFKDAISGKPGGFFAIGVTTGIPGYFMSSPIRSNGKVVGVAVVKVDLNPLQLDWKEGGETVFASDSNGVIFLSSRSDWKYRSLNPLTEDVQKSIRAGKQYHGVDLKPLIVGQDELSTPDTIKIDKTPFLIRTRDLPSLGWRIQFLSPLRAVQEQVFVITAMTTISAFLLIAVLLYLRERRLKQLSRRQAREAETFRDLNTQLRDEINERRRTEQELRDMQDDLIQAGKLAALGQMSAAIAHELNQPLAAIRTFVASSTKYAERGSTGQVIENLGTVAGLTERMSVITSQLKTFARKSDGKIEDVDFEDSLKHALMLLEGQIKQEGVELDLDISPGPLLVAGDSVRLEQVLVNLVRNGLDAMQNSQHRCLSIGLRRKDRTVEFSISDTGHGIDETLMGQLFDPFFTTKEVGEGVGLGLSISYGIIADMGGSIRSANNPGGGATFTISLKLINAGSDLRNGDKA